MRHSAHAKPARGDVHGSGSVPVASKAGPDWTQARSGGRSPFERRSFDRRGRERCYGPGRIFACGQIEADLCRYAGQGWFYITCLIEPELPALLWETPHGLALRPHRLARSYPLPCDRRPERPEDVGDCAQIVFVQVRADRRHRLCAGGFTRTAVGETNKRLVGKIRFLPLAGRQPVIQLGERRAVLRAALLLLNDLDVSSRLKRATLASHPTFCRPVDTRT